MNWPLVSRKKFERENRLRLETETKLRNLYFDHDGDIAGMLLVGKARQNGKLKPFSVDFTGVASPSNVLFDMDKATTRFRIGVRKNDRVVIKNRNKVVFDAFVRKAKDSDERSTPS